MRGLGRERPTAADPADLETRARPVLDRRLSAHAKAPLAVAFSGGGDSLALLLAAHAWASAKGRRLIALHVDHQLQPQSAEWADRCGRTAARLGIGFRAPAWCGDKPARGLPAAARLARHRLLAEAARQAGARVILFGHTADDLTETLAMRAEGSTTPLAREWGPSPVWPEGRGLFLLRPLLAVGREEIREWLAARGESWIDDPANLDLRYARARVRVAGAPFRPPRPGASVEGAADLALAVTLEPGDVMRIQRGRLGRSPPAAVAAFLSAACVSAGGGERPPRGGRAEALASRLRGEGEVVATLAGARIEADAEAVWVMREAGEADRGGLAEMAPSPGVPAVWDGRYEIVVQEAGRVRRLAGAARRLNEAQQRALSSVRASARGALPLIVSEGETFCPALADVGPGARFLAHARLLAACGAIDGEPTD